ncbi:MAG: metallophosphoesterase family protein [Bacteroidales bacterium]
MNFPIFESKSNMMKRYLLYFFVAALVVASACAPRSGDDSGNAAATPVYASTNHQSLLEIARLKTESDYTIPSFTRLRMAVTAVENDSTRAGELADALNSLVPAGMPFSVTVNIKGDPSSGMGFNWLTDSGYMSGQVQIVKGIAGNDRKFRRPFLTVRAVSVPVDTLPYSVRGNNLEALAGIPAGTKKSYSSHKATVSDLKPGRVYSYRVGNDENWSQTGTFTTAGRNQKEFSFMYTTDSQATTLADFDVSQTTTHTAFQIYPDVDLWICSGDLVNAAGTNNSQWEWDQFFGTQQDLFLNIPFAPVVGNHDRSPNKNFTYHFNTSEIDFDREMSTSPGSVYSFVYGNTLFLAMSFEDYRRDGYLEALAKWMKEEVEKNPDVRWRIAFYHKNIYTGAAHQTDADGIIVRDRFAPLFDSLKIDIALQGHDHVYQVIGPVKDKKLAPGSVSRLTEVSFDRRENLTGKMNGVFDVTEGTLYFLNNSAGKKKYNPRSKEDMDRDSERLGVPDYWSLFTGRFGQTGRPTFSHINVTDEKITVTTYEVSDDGREIPFDRFEVVKK